MAEEDGDRAAQAAGNGGQAYKEDLLSFYREICDGFRWAEVRLNVKSYQTYRMAIQELPPAQVVPSYIGQVMVVDDCVLIKQVTDERGGPLGDRIIPMGLVEFITPMEGPPSKKEGE